LSLNELFKVYSKIRLFRRIEPMTLNGITKPNMCWNFLL
jgi:hypothetical protein